MWVCAYHTHTLLVSISLKNNQSMMFAFILNTTHNELCTSYCINININININRSRQKSASRILKERGLGRMGIAMFGFRRKVQSNGTIVALAQSLLELVSTSVRLALFWTLKIAIFYPLVFLRRTLKKLKPAPEDAKTNQAA